MKTNQQMFLALARGENLSMKTIYFTYFIYLILEFKCKIMHMGLILIHIIISTETLDRESYPIVVVLENLVKPQLAP